MASPLAPTGQRSVHRPTMGPAQAAIPSWQTMATRAMEHAPQWNYPARNQIVAEMRTDGHIEGLEQAFFGPIHDLPWRLEPGDLPEVAAAKLADDLDLPVGVVDDSSTRRYQVGWNQLLTHALEHAPYGHAVAEIVGTVEADPGWWRIHRFALIEPDQIEPSKWMIEPDGTLQSITLRGLGPQPVVIEARQLQRWAYRPRQGDPTGRSMLRALYKHWLIIDELYRVDTVRHNKGAGGTWVVTGKDGDTRETVEDLADAFSETVVDELAAVGLEKGQTAENVGITGQTTNPIESIEHHQATMSRAWNEQVVQLGTQPNGSRSLGEVHESIADSARRWLAAQIAEELNRQTVSRWCEWNGIDISKLETPPRVTCEEPATVPVEITTTAGDLATLADKGLLTPDPVLEARIRSIAGLPERPEQEAPGGKSFAYDLDFGILTIDERRAQIGLPPLPNGAGAVPPTPADSVVPDVAAARARPGTADSGKVPGVPQAARKLKPHERNTSFAHIHDEWEDAAGELVVAYRAIRDAQIARAIGVVGSAASVLDALQTLRDDTRAAALDAIDPALTEQAIAALETTAQGSAETVADDAKEAGVEGHEPVAVDYHDSAELEVKLTTERLASSVADEVTDRTAQLAGPDATPQAVADAVKAQLDEQLTDAQLEKAAGADATRAQRAGRSAQAKALEGEIRDIYASSVLDGSTCGPCAENDGQQYDTVDEADSDFPSGGYLGCEGGERCRCIYVITYETEQALVIDDRETA